MNGYIHTMVASCLPITMLLKNGQISGVSIAQNKTQRVSISLLKTFYPVCKVWVFLGICVLGGGVSFSLMLGFFQLWEHSSAMNVSFELCLNCKLQDSDYEMSDSFPMPSKPLSSCLLYISN